MTDRLKREARIVSMMIELYCKKRLRLSEVPDEYRRLEAYAHRRLQRCSWGDKKPACKECPHHCYAPKEAEMIREVMRWTGPRMFLYAPIAAIRHLLKID